MTPAAVVLRRVEVGLTARLEHLLGLQPVPWPEVAAIAANLATIMGATAPGPGGRLLTTAEMAARLGVSPKTVLRKRKAGALTPAHQLGGHGGRGRADFRWAP